MNYNFVFTWFTISLCHASIKLDIYVASKPVEAAVRFTGEDNKLVTKEETNVFNLTTANINRGMKIELGKIPDNVFLRDPTKYDNLYKLFKWTEVKRNLRIKSAKVTEVITENVVLKVVEQINNTTETMKFDIAVEENVENTIVSTWSEGGVPKGDIFYDTNIHFDRFGYKYKNNWRNMTLRSIYLPFGVAIDGYVNVESGQTVTYKLSASKTIMLIRVDYTAKLFGSIIADYDELYGKYHFYAPSVQSIMDAAKLRNEVITTESFELRCYTEAKLEIFDKETGEPVNIVTRIKPLRGRKKLNSSTTQITPTINVIRV